MNIGILITLMYAYECPDNKNEKKHWLLTMLIDHWIKVITVDLKI